MTQRFDTVIPSIFNKIKPGSTFLSITGYTNNYNEVSNFGIVFHANYNNAIKKSLRILREFKPSSVLEDDAKFKLIESYSRSVDNFRLHNKNPGIYSKIYDSFNKPIDGVKLHNRNQEIHLYGFVFNKKIIKPGDYSTAPRRSDITATKDELLKLTPLGKFRQFKLVPGRFEKISVCNLTLTEQDLINKFEI